MSPLYSFEIRRTNGEVLKMQEFVGKVLLIVNTATKCGLAPQFEELETLWNTYSHDDFLVLGFPCNQFMNQEPETDETMETACKLNF